MIKIVVASKNPVKLDAVKEGLSFFLNQQVDVLGVSVGSGVSDQPMSDLETLQGAETRVKNTQIQFPDYDFYVGVEGGVEESVSGLMAFAWIVISNGTTTGKARTAGFFLPPQVGVLVHQGFELGDADDMVFDKKNSKQQNGAVGLLTNDVITRKSLYMPAVQMAFIPFLNPGLYP
ncbi:MAG: inosine/xanthosine triphosphatase [Bacteroidota bacterium]|nr:inositol monophosphatase [Odoribacter sp.]MDP3643730.1 inosine/xanthosine triphosphatase [Bacteroidota bacterium]